MANNPASNYRSSKLNKTNYYTRGCWITGCYNQLGAVFIVSYSTRSSELNDSGDQAADSQQQEAEETIPESSTPRYGRKRTRVLREKLCAMA